MNRPNIVFAFADDWGRYASAYAAHEGPGSINELIDTPNFDRVAREGVLFTNAVVPAPSCTPCRSSILAGQYFWQTGMGAILQGARWDEAIPTYPLELERAGYHIGYTYKVWSPGKTMNAPYGAERTRYEPAGSDFNRFSHWVTEQAGTGTGDAAPAAEARVEAAGADRADGGPPLAERVESAKRHLLDETGDNFRSFLDARPDDAPFCYWWGPTNTHRTWERGSGKALWGLDPDALQGRLPAYLPDVPEVREDVCDYLGECLAVDAGLGEIVDELERRGELDNTLLVVSGDHGIPGIPRGKCNLYDLGSEVALAVRWPGRVPGGRVVDDMVNLMDLGPTFLEAADVPIPGTMTARSLMPVLESADSGRIDPERDHVVIGRERHVATAREGNVPYPQRAIRTHDYLYIRNYAPERWPMGDPRGLADDGATAASEHDLTWNTHATFSDLDASPTKAFMVLHRDDEGVRPLFELGFGKRPAEELYDLRTDPDHMVNVVDEKRYADVRAELDGRLEGVLLAQRDPRVV
ncbi:MAG: sulfatase, partial [Spirochaetota bacterium]